MWTFTLTRCIWKQLLPPSCFSVAGGRTASCSGVVITDASGSSHLFFSFCGFISFPMWWFPYWHFRLSVLKSEFNNWAYSKNPLQSMFTSSEKKGHEDIRNVPNKRTRRRRTADVLVSFVLDFNHLSDKGHWRVDVKTIKVPGISWGLLAFLQMAPGLIWN